VKPWGTASGAALLAAGLALPPVARGEGFQFGVLAGYSDLTRAKDSASAVFGGSTGAFSFGAEAGYEHRLGVFLSGSFRYFEKDGERVFVAAPGEPVFPLGHPLSVRIVPVSLTAGYRFLRTSLVSPYVALGVGLASYREESTVGGITSSESRNELETRVVAGAQLGRGRLRFGVEGCYSRIPETIGFGGVSSLYGEDDVGGLAVFGKVIYSLGR
jgi:opacity protein-like surface antigen